MMAHGSLHPCSWCDIDKNHLGQKGQSRTIQGLRDLFWSYYNAGAGKNKAKHYGNVIHPPVMTEANGDTPVIALVPPPELHLLTGPVNTMYNQMNKLWTESEEWLKASRVEREAAHGGCFTGNASRILLKNTDKLDAMAPISCKPYVAAFRAFDKVVEGCYSLDLADNYDERIQIFHSAYLDLEINITPKVHAVLFHIPEFCGLKGKGLGPWSEQTGESVHHDFLHVWNNFKVNSLDHPEYGNGLLSAVKMYKSQHL